jgi:hypothetical protein
MFMENTIHQQGVPMDYIDAIRLEEFRQVRGELENLDKG